MSAVFDLVDEKCMNCQPRKDRSFTVQHGRQSKGKQLTAFVYFFLITDVFLFVVRLYTCSGPHCFRTPFDNQDYFESHTLYSFLVNRGTNGRSSVCTGSYSGRFNTWHSPVFLEYFLSCSGIQPIAFNETPTHRHLSVRCSAGIDLTCRLAFECSEWCLCKSELEPLKSELTMSS